MRSLLYLLFTFFISTKIIYFSADTLQNCTLELATLGDLKLVEKPQPIVLAPHDFCNIKANVKVASTENGIIFGNIGNFNNKILFKNFVLKYFAQFHYRFIYIQLFMF